MDNSIKQLTLILIVLLIKLGFDVENVLYENIQSWDIYIDPYLYFLLPSLQIIALILVCIISFTNLKSKEPSNKLRNYIYIALSVALLSTTIEFLVYWANILLDS